MPFPSLGDLPDPGIEAVSPTSHALAGEFLTTAPPGKPSEWRRGAQFPTQRLKGPLAPHPGIAGLQELSQWDTGERLVQTPRLPSGEAEACGKGAICSRSGCYADEGVGPDLGSPRQVQ